MMTTADGMPLAISGRHPKHLIISDIYRVVTEIAVVHPDIARSFFKVHYTPFTLSENLVSSCLFIHLYIVEDSPQKWFSMTGTKDTEEDRFVMFPCGDVVDFKHCPEYVSQCPICYEPIVGATKMIYLSMSH